jgi:hypothetical protein
MGVLLMHPGIRMPDELLPDLRGNAAVCQLGHKGMPQTVKALAIRSSTHVFAHVFYSVGRVFTEEPNRLNVPFKLLISGHTECFKN